MLLTIPISEIKHFVEDRIYLPDNIFRNMRLFPKEPLIEYWQYLVKYYSPNSTFDNFNEYIGDIDLIDDVNYQTINHHEIFSYIQPEYFVFKFPDEETALYFKMKVCL